MAKKKRKKIKVNQPPKEVSRKQQERSYIIAKRMLPLFDLEPALLDVFTKKQKQLLCGLAFDYPSVKAEKEKTVPGRFVKKIREEMIRFMRTNYYGSSEHGITHMDFTMYGYAFYTMLHTHIDKGTFTGTPQEETAKLICGKIEESELINYSALKEHLMYQTRSISRVNFRVYGFNYDWEESRTKVTADGYITMQMKIRLTVQDCETKMFNYKNIERKAFRLIYTADGDEKTQGAVINKNKIFPYGKEDEKFNIYIQSHALNRYKQRVDILEPPELNYQIQQILITEQKIIRFENQNLIACTLDNAIIGYFTYFLRESDMIINTFLPITTENTPEGKKLRDLLLLSNEDIVFLGMDKLSFYATIDFEQIPALKQVLINSDLWNTKTAIDSALQKKGEITIDMNSTLFVKKFMDKHERYRAEMLLSDNVKNMDWTDDLGNN
jgi:hypothetical protein